MNKKNLTQSVIVPFRLAGTAPIELKDSAMLETIDRPDIIRDLEAWTRIRPPGDLRDALYRVSQDMAMQRASLSASTAVSMLEEFIYEMTENRYGR